MLLLIALLSLPVRNTPQPLELTKAYQECLGSLATLHCNPISFSLATGPYCLVLFARSLVDIRWTEMKSHRTKAFVIAFGLCIAFYVFVHQPFMHHSILHTYTTEHATEYAIVGLFFWANVDLALSMLRNRGEYQSNRYQCCPNAKESNQFRMLIRSTFFCLPVPRSFIQALCFDV